MDKACEKIRESLPLYIDQMLSEEEMQQTEAHVQKCQDCQEELAFLKAVIKTSRTLLELEVSESFKAGLHEKLLQEAESRKTSVKRFPIRRYVSGFATAAAVIALSVVTLTNLPEHPDLTSQNRPHEYTVKTEEKLPVSEEKQPEETKAESSPKQSAPSPATVERIGSVAKAETAGRVLTGKTETEERQEIPQKEETPVPAAEHAEAEPVTESGQGRRIAEGTNSQTPSVASFSMEEETAEREIFCYYLTESGLIEAEKLFLDYRETEHGFFVPYEASASIHEAIGALDGFLSLEIQQEPISFDAEEDGVYFLLCAG